MKTNACLFVVGVLLAGSAAAAPLRFLSFNIWGDYFKNPVEEREAGVERSIRKHNPDIVSLQEVTPNRWASRMFSNLSASYGIVRGDENEALHRAGAADTSLKPANWVNHEPLLYRKDRLKLLDSGCDFFHLTLQAEKSLSWAVLEDKQDGRRLIAFATHFWWMGNGKESDTLRELNARQVLWRVAEIRQKWGPLPVIGGGDLNSAPGSLAHEVFRLAGYHNAADEADARSPHRSHHGDPKRGADGAYHGSLRPSAEDTPGLSIDHVFFTDGIHARRHQIGTDQAELDVSDHSPVLVEFELTEPQKGAPRISGSPSTRFVQEARKAYSSTGFASYTNSIVYRFVGRPDTLLDSPRAGDLVRWIAVRGVRNVRDIGGWTGLRTGRVYRGSELNPVADHKLSIHRTGINLLVHQLGIRSDLDFRAVNPKERGDCVTNSALGAMVRLIDRPIGAYTELFTQTNQYAAVMRVFADESNYPIYMHCWGGVDRTGTVAFFLEGLCGVSEADLAIDYELSSFASFGLRTRANMGNYRYGDLIARIKTYPGATLRDKFESCAKTTLGLRDSEIAAIRRNLSAAGF